ncbi:MAG: 1-acyl-sn-glycerol-3-phosphate acyltransferase [Pseudonocardia sp.]|nr:1-acyl-sn-glycerol-3-phosphate acyltransferase [Pseudonocardia sp.]
MTAELSPQADAVTAAPPHPVLPAVRDRVGNVWQPASACTAGCLPDLDSLPRVSTARVAVRLIGLIALLAGALVAAPVLPLLAPDRRTAALCALFRAVLRVAGVRLDHRGDRRLDKGDQTGVLVVSNHISWLDILALGTVQPLRMVAKREIRDWPVLGGLAARTGTLFVDRTGLRGLPSVVAEASAALRAGSVVGLFPEGTTWCGAASGVFRRAGFQAALDADVPVRPVAQRLRLPDGTPATVGAFIGDDNLADSLLRVLRLPYLVVEIHVLPLLVAGPETDRREFARRAELAIAEVTGVPAPPVIRPPRAVRLAA